MRQRPAVAAAVTGNSRLLATYSSTGELQALYWPHIDYGQHIHELQLGVRVGTDPVRWLNTAEWTVTQQYVPDTAVLITASAAPDLTVECADFALPNRDLLIRRLTVSNWADGPRPVQLCVYVHPRLDESAQYNTVLRANEVNGLLVYRRNTWLALGADRAPTAWQCGRPDRPSDAWPQACAGDLQGDTINCGDVNGALLFDLGMLPAGGAASLALYLAPGDSRDAVVGEVQRARTGAPQGWEAETAAWWRQWLASGRQVTTGSEELDRIYRQSLVMLKLMSDERGGGLIAGPELDPDYQLSGGYAYCWGRDAAYMTTALDEAGHFAETDRFFRQWAVRAQEPDGSWLHRHYVDGTLGPSWGHLQIDEGASILFGAWRHFELSGDREFALAFWPEARRGADYLLAYRDPATGLPDHSIDLWEKRDGLHTYSSAAVHAGLTAAAQLAATVGEDGSRYAEAAASVRQAMEQHLWSESRGRFLRTIGLVGTGPAEAGRQDLAMADLPDIALLGVTFPFGAFAPDDERVQRTAAALEAALVVPGTGAVYRYVGDKYIGGHPWLICTLWLAICKLAAGEQARARELISWAAGKATPLGMLPEQVDVATGSPTWVTPLAWSHAMFVLAVHRLVQ